MLNPSLEHNTEIYYDDVPFNLSEMELGIYKYKYDITDYEENEENDEFLDYCVELLTMEPEDVE